MFWNAKNSSKTQSLFGLEQFWIISLKTHNWVIKKRGTHTNFVVWLDFLMLFSSLILKNFEREWWKLKTANWCFQKLKTEFQWHNGKYFDFVGLVCCEWSYQFPKPLILLLERFLFPSFFFSSFSRPSLRLPLISSTLHSQRHLRWWTDAIKPLEMNTPWLKTNNRGVAKSSLRQTGLYHR